MKTHSAEIVRFIGTLLTECALMLTRQGESRSDADKLSHDFAIEVSWQLAGQLMYFGKNTGIEAQTRHRLIRDDYWNGKAINQLSTLYSLSTRQIYTIIHESKNTETAKTATTGAPAIAIAMARIMIRSGVDQETAVSASRSLLAVISAKFGGKGIYIPKPRNVQIIIRNIEIYRAHNSGKSIKRLAALFELSTEEIKTIIEQHPVTKNPVSRNRLMLLNKRVLEVIEEYREFDPEISRLLSLTAENVNNACQIIATLEQQKGDLTHIKEITVANL